MGNVYFHLKCFSFSPEVACNFIKKETLAQVFSCEFCGISKNIFFTEQLWAIGSDGNELQRLVPGGEAFN